MAPWSSEMRGSTVSDRQSSNELLADMGRATTSPSSAVAVSPGRRGAVFSPPTSPNSARAGKVSGSGYGAVTVTEDRL